MSDVKEPKILLWDLETGGVNALKSNLGFVLCFGWKWFKEKQTYCYTLEEYDGFKKGSFDDSKLLKAAIKVMETADILVAHYGDKFDRRFFQGRCAINHIQPPPPTKQRDTCLIARRAFNFSSNRLGALAKTLGCKERKQLHDGWPDWWLRVLAGDKLALELMAEYCKQDVRTLESVYEKIRCYDHFHPRLFVDRDSCGVCNGRIQYRGSVPIGQYKYRRWQCTRCGKWGRETKRVV